MSVPAPSLPLPGSRPRRSVVPERVHPIPRQRTEEPRPSRLASPSRRAAARPRRRTPLAFAAFAGIVVATLLVAGVSVQVMLAQTSFHATELHTRIAELSDRYEVLAAEAAALSSPGRVAEWAEARGFVQADGAHTVILHVPTHGGGDGVSELGRDAALVKPIVGGSG